MNINIEVLPSKELIPGFEGRFVHTENMTIAYWEIKSGSLLPKHSHHNEQVCQVTEGEFELVVGDEVYHVSPGQVVVIPPNVEHYGKALTDCKITDIFYPLREDYK